MLIMTTLLSFSVSNSDDQNIQAPKRAKTERAKLSFIPSDNSSKATEAKSTTESYTVKNGDTLESIVIRFYGKFDLSKVEKD